MINDSSHVLSSDSLNRVYKESLRTWQSAHNTNRNKKAGHEMKTISKLSTLQT